MFCYGKNVSRLKASFDHSNAVNFDAVAALKVIDKPITFPDLQFAMMSRNIAETQNDITTFTSTYEQLRCQQRDDVPSTLRYELT
jgi:hypothetical protein